MDNGGIAKAFILCIIGLVTSIVLAVSVFFVYRQILINESRIMMTYLDVPFRQAEKQLLTCQAFLEAAKVPLIQQSRLERGRPGR
ncbi:MAG: hypothetical protein P4M11_15670 [Candidatus Pacebacteria bacterium]|nr:hypothetical protein [Candidatus Paceibacterota bacterium]